MIRFASPFGARAARTSRFAASFAVSLSTCIASLSCAPASAPLAPTPIVETQTESPEGDERCQARSKARTVTNEADATVKVNLGGAIALYEKALTLDPKDASICFKLARAYEKAEQWQPMESALARAAMLEPNVPTYSYLQGYALVQLGLEGDTSAFQRAIPVLLHCIELDRYHPECHALLGVASEATLDTNIALQSYTRAIQAEPAQAKNYVALGTLYYNLDRPLEANEVFERGSQEIAPSENNRVALSALHLAWSKVASSRGDTATEVVQLEKAKAMAVDTSQIDFRLGRAYAVQGRNDDAKAVLSAFSKRVCKGTLAQKFRSECDQAQMWLYRLGQP